MSKKHTLTGFIIGLAISSGILLLLLPGLFEQASPGHIWFTWLFFGLTVSCAAGTFLTRRSAQ